MDTAHGNYPSTKASRDRNGQGPAQTAVDPASIVNHFGGMNLGAMPMPHHNSANMPMGHAPALMMGTDGHVMYAPMHHGQPMGVGHGSEHMYPGYPLGANTFGPPYMGMHVPLMPMTPGRLNAQLRVDKSHSEVPDLENRRGSYSTTESAPATPFYTGVVHREAGPRVASFDRSSYTTPSPHQLDVTRIHVDQPVKGALPPIKDEELDEILEQSPPVPRAVPAVFTPSNQMKSVEASLENRIPGNRNVYIRGLHPTTDDELLFLFAGRFGKVECSKAIIDTATGACKGFGFAKFARLRDSENCIRGFHRLGYEVGFARVSSSELEMRFVAKQQQESFNSRLKAEGDETSTNMYISNLPKSLTEVELETIFLGYNIVSSKILRDNMGNSRGVGFARFDTRDACEDVMNKYNGVGIGEEGLLMNIRYADTSAQKELKRITAERRQFRTNEYNIGAYGTPLVGMNPAVNHDSRQYQWVQNNGAPRSNNRLPSRDATRMMGHSGSMRQSETSTGTSGNVSTPLSSESDEGVTLRAVHVGDDAPHGSTQSSPIKKSKFGKEE